ncbi:MAG: diphthine--ammonia ligase [Kiritimatiellae bacterium]|nr:diphthine--ammonia ligase [Kiritimatiellia bacterium]
MKKINAQPNLTPPSNALFFSSWSGGKDSCLALHRACMAGAKPACLLTIICEDGLRSRSHGLRRDVIAAQATALGIPLLTRCATWAGYEAAFVDALHAIRAKGIQGGIFGDIDFPPHREWEEKVCAQAGLIPYLPLWGDARPALLREFIALGYKALIVRINESKLSREFLGRTIDAKIIGEFQKIGIDPCGENGEYHTIVVDGPIFSGPLSVTIGSRLDTECSGYCTLDIHVQNVDEDAGADDR